MAQSTGITELEASETERNRVREALREGEGKLGSIVKNPPDKIIIVDPNHIAHYANSIVSHLTIDEVIGKCVFDYRPPSQSGKSKPNIRDFPIDSGPFSDLMKTVNNSVDKLCLENKLTESLLYLIS